MKAYLVTTSVLFTLITLAHVARMVFESAALTRDPWFLFLTVLAAGLAVWGFRLARRISSDRSAAPGDRGAQ